jgi:hypothetical protein
LRAARINTRCLTHPFLSHRFPLDRETYRALVVDIDCALVVHKAQHFELVASGAIADTFACVKPLIALRSSLTEYYFETTGNIGYMCEDLDDMKGIIFSILESKPVARYRAQQNNIRENRDRFSPVEISNKLRTVMELPHFRRQRFCSH